MCRIDKESISLNFLCRKHEEIMEDTRIFLGNVKYHAL